MKCPICNSKKVVAHGFQKGEFKHTYQHCPDCGFTQGMRK
jgi:transcription elongation factor Elf1